MKLNVGCGFKKLEGYVNLDSNPFVQPDIVRDIEKGLPWNDNSFEEIICEHTLEHIKDLIFVMNEFHRVLISGGLLNIKVPNMIEEHAWIDPTHKRYFTFHGFDFFIVRDFNSLNAGVNGWYEPIEWSDEKDSEIHYILKVIK